MARSRRPGAATDGEPVLQVTRRRLLSGERLVLYSDGVSERPTRDGRAFGPEGIRRAVARASSAAAPVELTPSPAPAALTSAAAGR